MVKHIVKKKPQKAPFHHWKIKPPETFPAEIPGIGSGPATEKIAGRDEEERHVEGIEARSEKARIFRVSYHHKDDRHCLCDGYRCVALH